MMSTEIGKCPLHFLRKEAVSFLRYSLLNFNFFVGYFRKERFSISVTVASTIDWLTPVFSIISNSM